MGSKVVNGFCCLELLKKLFFFRFIFWISYCVSLFNFYLWITTICLFSKGILNFSMLPLRLEFPLYWLLQMERVSLDARSLRFSLEPSLILRLEFLKPRFLARISLTTSWDSLWLLKMDFFSYLCTHLPNNLTLNLPTLSTSRSLLYLIKLSIFFLVISKCGLVCMVGSVVELLLFLHFKSIALLIVWN